MKQIQIKRKYLLTIFSLITCLTVYSCSPSINSFSVEPSTIVKNDPVFVTWDVSRGTPVLKVQEPTKTEKIGDSIVRFIDYTLVIKEDENIKSTQTVKIVPHVLLDTIVFETNFFGDKQEDTLVAQGIKNIESWGKDFEILSITSADTNGRELYVIHGGKAILIPNGVPTEEFKGTPIEGKWEIRYIMSAYEIENRKIRPAFLKLNALIQYKKRKL